MANPFSIDVPQLASPADLAIRRYTLQNLVAESQLRQQQAQVSALQVQQTQRVLQDQQTVQAGMQDWSKNNPGKAFDYDDFRNNYLVGKVALPTLQAFDDENVKNQQAALNLYKAKGDKAIQDNEAIGSAADAIYNAPDNVKGDVLRASIANLQKRGIQVPDQFAQGPVPSQDQLQSLMQMTQYWGKHLTNAKQQTENQANALAETNKEIASLAQDPPTNQADWDARLSTMSDAARARLPQTYTPAAISALQRNQVDMKDRPKYDLALAAAAFRNNLDGKKMNDMVDSEIDPTKYPAINKQAKAGVANAIMLGGEDPMKAARDTLDKFSESVKQAELSATPSVMQNKAQQAAMEAAATRPERVATAVATQQALESPYSGPNKALAGVPVKLVTQATSAYNKANQDYVGAVNAADEMGDIIDAARSGNKVAYAYAPTTGVLTINTANGVKRINMPEIRSYGASGSAADRIEGWLGKQATGKSIPSDILDAMDQLHGGLAQVASQKYDNTLTSLRQTYGGAFPRVGIAPKARGVAAKTYTQADVEAAVKAHPGTTADQIDAAFKAKGWTKK